MSDSGVRVIEVVVTTLMVRGAGTDADPKRRVTQYWSRDGELLAESDPCATDCQCRAAR